MSNEQSNDNTGAPSPSPINTRDSGVVDTPNLAPEASTSAPTPEVVNNTTPEITENKGKITENKQNVENTLENQTPTSEPLETKIETNEIPENTEIPTSKPVSTGTAQIPGNELLTPKPEPLKSEPEPSQVSTSQPQPTPVPVFVPPQEDKKSIARSLLTKALNTIQFRKRKKLDKIMTMFSKNSKITNNEVEKLLHVSDATAERYLNMLEKENKIRQTGKTGKNVFYIKI